MGSLWNVGKILLKIVRVVIMKKGFWIIIGIFILTSIISTTIMIDPILNEKKKGTIKIEDLPWSHRAINYDRALIKHLGEGVKVAVLDTGVDFTHSDIKIQGGVSIIDSSMNFIDHIGHGTNVAGVIISENRKIGIAPEVDLYAVKIIDIDGGGDDASLIQGVQWAIDNKMNILVMSIGTRDYSKELEKTIDRAYQSGIFIVAPVGNNEDIEESVYYPARFEKVFSVGSINKEFKRSNFSNYGRNLDIMAPGEEIYSTSLNNGYSFERGTSMAASFVAGAAAILLSADKKLTNKELEDILRKSATQLGDNREYGSGLLNIDKALKLVTEKEKQ